MSVEKKTNNKLNKLRSSEFLFSEDKNKTRRNITIKKKKKSILSNKENRIINI